MATSLAGVVAPELLAKRGAYYTNTCAICWMIKTFSIKHEHRLCAYHLGRNATTKGVVYLLCVYFVFDEIV